MFKGRVHRYAEVGGISYFPPHQPWQLPRLTLALPRLDLGMPRLTLALPRLTLALPRLDVGTAKVGPWHCLGCYTRLTLALPRLDLGTAKVATQGLICIPVHSTFN